MRLIKALIIDSNADIINQLTNFAEENSVIIDICGASNSLEEGIELGALFVALYDHPDKYLPPSQGGNPYCEGGAEDTRVYLTKSTHWKITNSTTMTFASKVSTLKRTEPILRKYTQGSYPEDFKMFLELREQGELLITPLPGFATHGETKWLSPLTDWSQI